MRNVIKPNLKFGVKFLLLSMAAVATFELIKSLVIIGRRKLARPA